MQLHSTTKYAIRIMNYMVNGDKNNLFNAKDISEKLDIPYKYLSRIMGDLTKAELIVSVRGREGGYKIARSASTIFLIDILNIFDEFKHKQECLLGIGLCDGTNKCSMHDQWVEPKNLIEKMFEETSLDNLSGSEFKI